jgi:hypothetical protein
MRFKGLGSLGVLATVLFFVSIPAMAQYFPFYVLDGYGGVHAGGGAVAITPATPYFGWDIAKAIEYVSVGYSSSAYGDGLIVLDGYGGVHKGGALAPVSVAATPYFGWNIARDLTMRLIPPRVTSSTSVHGPYNFTSTSYTLIAGPAYIYAPDDGYVTLCASAVVQNATVNTVAAQYGFSMDEYSSTLADFRGYEDIQSTSTETITLNQTYFMPAGSHYFCFVLRLPSGGTVKYEHTSLSVIYVDQSNSGYSGLSKIEK